MKIIYFQEPGEVGEDGTLVRSIDCELNCKRPPLVLGAGFQMYCGPMVLSIALKTSVSFEYPVSDSFTLDQDTVSLVLSSRIPDVKAVMLALSDKRSNFFIATDTITPIMTITEISSIMVKPF